MKKEILFLFLATMALSSCCNQQYCVSAPGFPMKFYGFTLADLDTIYTTGYKPGSYFQEMTRAEKADSVRTSFDTPTNFILHIKDKNGAGDYLDDQHDWKIFIPAVNKTLLIGNYVYSTHDCNKCTMGDVNSHWLSTCTINGHTEDIYNIRIGK